MTEDDLKPGMRLQVREASNTISRATYIVELEIVWLESGHVHYRKNQSAVRQTPVDRFLDIINNQPREWH